MPDASIDLALYSAALNVTVPPALIRPFLDQLAEGQFSIDEIRKRCAENGVRLKAHLRKGERTRKDLRAAFDMQSVERRHLDILDMLIASLEAKAARDVSEFDGLLDDFKKKVSALSASVDADEASELDEIYRTIEAQVRVEVGELCDVALFLRGLRSRCSDDRGEKEHLADSESLKKLLGSLSPPKPPSVS
ncbi:hypothetical protein [Ensifer sp. LC163]|uniref:hypothetical protein n=1 Tax=Ensifer sp. LC163 TaxID=1120652 RepID=UPI000813986F|nr:hypothetical protein [Ensifer sp. LC163]OCP38608.1 hypothetical protein BC360_00605 [Ensifer sp. LC163]